MQPQIDPLTLGVALTVLGMGGTLLSLLLLSLVADLLKRLFPLSREVAAPAPPASSAQPPATA